jgi:hypothetical protein
MISAAIRPAPIADTFEAVMIASVGFGCKGKTYPIGNAEDSLERCLEMAPLVHKQHFFVRHTNALTGEVMLSFYVVKKAKPVLRFHEHRHRMVADLYAEHLFDLNGSAL